MSGASEGTIHAMLEVRGLIMGQCQQHLNSSAIQIIGGANANQHPLILQQQDKRFQNGFHYCLKYFIGFDS